MAGKRLNPRRAKINRSYTVEEVARLYDVDRQTVRNWIRIGLPAMTGARPHLIDGAELRAFLEQRRAIGKVHCGPGELYCLKCRSARPAAEGMLDYIPISNISGNLRALCPVCSCLMHRRASLQKLDTVRGSCTVAFPHGQKRLTDCDRPSLNCHPEPDRRTANDKA